MVAFEFNDVPQNKGRWWLLSEGEAADLCMTDPGHEVDVFLATDVRTMTAIWTDDITLASEIASGALEVHGPADRLR